MNLIYLVFGKKLAYHYEAIFSICSFLASTKSIEKVFIYTDEPKFYKHLGDKVTIRLVDENLLKEWEGKYQFFWRVKIKAFEDAILQNPEKKTVYLDSDTFVYKPLENFEKLLDEGNAFMHKQEALLSNSSSGTQTKMWKQMKGKTFVGIMTHKNHAMWNAGLIALPACKQKETINLALQLCDAMSAAGVTPRLIEQFAFSLALQETYRLLPADNFVGHYWGNKNEWDSFINDYFVQSHFQNETIDNEIENIQKLNFGKIPLIRKERTLYKQINKLLRKCLPFREKFIE